MTQMNIRQAARWAERKGILYTVNRHTGQPDHLYAVYDTGNHMVDLIGGYDKCKAIMPPHSQPTADGRWLRLQCLDEVCQEMDESDGEAACLPDACEVREWA
jgi:hypothetical protein